MTIEQLRASGTIILDCVSGSQAYGLATPTSDIDLKGVFCVRRATLFGLDYIEQVANDTNDEVYYELGRFFELAEKNNPNILELLATPTQHIRYRHPALDQLSPELFLSKRCEQTFAGYAMSQVKKARGLNKKIVNPMPQKRKGLLDFCFVLVDAGTQPVLDWLLGQGITQQQCGLIKMPNAKGMHGLYVDRGQGLGYNGIISGDEANAVRLSSVPKGESLAAYLYVHLDGYSQHCRAHREYWQWTERRNGVRYASTEAHGQGYDAKNMMHVFRLLDVAAEILYHGELRVERPNRDELLAIKSGVFEYEELLIRAKKRMEIVASAAQQSTLPQIPNRVAINQTLVRIRDRIYYGKNDA